MSAPKAGSTDSTTPISLPEGLDKLLQPGTVPNSLGRLGHYEILKLLGRGAFGTVVRGLDVKLEREVAIKILDTRHGANSVAGVRFLREARASAVIRHENVVQVYAVEEKPTPYLVMEYVPGGSLEDLIHKGDRLPVEVVRRVAEQIARGLAAAHDRGLVHRDLKPANILVETVHGRPRAKLADFGLAITAADIRLTQSGVIVGTPVYMAPEQTRGEPLDHRADLFSLGSVIYKAVTGATPFDSPDVVSVLHRINNVHPQPLHVVAPDTPRGLSDIVVKLLAKRPEDRFQSALEVADALTKPVTLTDCPPVEKTVSVLPSRKQIPPEGEKAKSRWAWVAGAAAVLLIGGGITAYLLVGKKKPADDGSPPPTSPASEFPKPPLPSGPDALLPPPPPLPLPPPPTKANPVAQYAPHPIADRWLSPDAEWTTPKNLGRGINTNRRELMATLTDDERTIVFCRDRDSKLFTSRRANRDDDFPDAEPLSDAINNVTSQSPTLTGDGLRLTYCDLSDKAHSVARSCRRATVDDPFGKPELEPEPVFIAAGWNAATVQSANGRWLAVSSSRLGMPSAGVLLFGRRASDGPFGPPARIANPEVPLHQTPSWLSADGCLLVCVVRDETDKAAPKESLRLFTRGSADGTFGPARPFHPLPDVTMIGRPWFTPDGRRMYFHTRSLPGGAGELDLWMTELRPKAK